MGFQYGKSGKKEVFLCRKRRHFDWCQSKRGWQGIFDYGLSFKAGVLIAEIEGKAVTTHLITALKLNYIPAEVEAGLNLFREAKATAYVVFRHFGFDNLKSPNYLYLLGLKA